MMKHNSLITNQIKRHDFICEDTFRDNQVLVVYTLSLQVQVESNLLFSYLVFIP